MEISLRLFSTQAHREQIDAGRTQRALRFAVLRVDLALASLPEFLPGIRMPASGIIRDGLDAYVLDGDGRRITGASAMREAQGLARASDLIETFSDKTSRRPLAWTGSGNTVQNLGCIAYVGASGDLFHSTSEYQRLSEGEPYEGAVFYRKTVAVERLTFSRRQNKFVPLLPNTEASDIHLIVTGQRLLRAGSIVDPYVDSKVAEKYPDKRHLIQNPYPKMSHPNGTPGKDESDNAIRKDFGLDQLLSDESLLAGALSGERVELSFNMRDVDGTPYKVTPMDLRAALKDKGYDVCESRNDLSARGECFIDEDNERLHIRFNRTPYPHHFIALAENNESVFFDGVVGGWSNNGGTNPYDLAKDLQRAGFKEALLLDNGGDCVLSHYSDRGFPDPRRATVPSCEEREEWAGVILYAAAHGDTNDAGIIFKSASEKAGAFTAHFD